MTATVVPDSIEPVEEWRSWRFFDGRLWSHNGARWDPGEPHKAICNGGGERHIWTIERGHGFTREEAAQRSDEYNRSSKEWVMQSPSARAYTYLAPPRVEPPKGFSYVFRTVTHDAPDAACNCGIYAGRTPEDCPPGDVLGKVKMWGKIVPGTKGSRAEFAYPSELHVLANHIDDPALLAYGVPVVALENKELVIRQPEFPRPNWPLRLALAFNVAAGSANLALIAIRAWL